VTLDPSDQGSSARRPNEGTALALACHGLVKRFPGVLALDDVDLEVEAG